MQTQQSQLSHIFIKYAINEFGKNCLLIKYKSNHFFHESDLGFHEFNRLFTLIQEFLNTQNPILELPGNSSFPSQTSTCGYSISKYNFLLVIIYNIYNYPSLKEEAFKHYINHFKDINTIPICNSSDQMMLLFNLIEFELKYHIRNEQELQSLYNALIQFENTSKSSEDKILYCYYIGAICFLLKHYSITEEYTSKFIMILNELYEPNKPENQIDLIRYLTIRNSILRIQSLEEENEEKNRSEIINYLETLLEDTRVQKEDLAIKIGLKMYTLQAKMGEYKKCISTLEVLVKILRKEMLQGKSHRALLEQLLYICGLLGYYNTLIGNNNEVQKYSKKIIKAVNYLRKINAGVNQNSNNLLPKYGFYSVILDKITSGGKTSENDVEESIRIYQTKIKDCNDAEILDIYLMNASNINEIAFKNKYENYMQLLNDKTPLENEQVFTFYVYHFNNLSILHSIMSKSNLSQIRDISNNLILYTKHYIINENSDYLKKTFQLNYFKTLLINIYTILISTYYFENNYNEVLERCNDFLQLVKIQFEMNNVNYSHILKFKGDALFQMHNYTEAYDCLKEAKNMTTDNQMKSNLLCKMAMCGILLHGQKNKAIELLDQALECVKEEDENKKDIEELIQKISKL